MSILVDKDKRDNFRKILLNFYKNHSYCDNKDERYYDHPLIDDREFSNTGKVRNKWTKEVLKQQVNANGYFGINVKINGKGRRFAFFHRLLMESALPYVGINNYFYEVNHIDGNKKNNQLENLEWVTREENLEHSRVNRLTNIMKGEYHPNCKIKDKDILDMRELKSLNFTIKDIALSYSIDRNHCSNLIKNGR